MYNFGECALCPRRCKADRINSRGFCGAPAEVRAAKAMLHFGEEPCISGQKGSGTIFFSGCSLRCVFCQNFEISKGNFGKNISVSRLAQICLSLQKNGAHNINFVSAAPYVPFIVEALDMLKDKLFIPTVYNSSGYESLETLGMLKGYIDIYLPDFKYVSPLLSAKYSGAPDYAEFALPAVKAMIEQVGKPVFDKAGIMRKGVIIRHLVLPGAYRDSCAVLELLHRQLPKDSFLISLMSQYTPEFLRADFSELKRKITSYEYRKVLDAAAALGMTEGYMQDKSSTGTQMTPVFDLEGIS